MGTGIQLEGDLGKILALGLRGRNFALYWSQGEVISGILVSGRIFFFMPPTLKKLMGHIAFGGCVTLFVPTVTFKPLKLES